MRGYRENTTESVTQQQQEQVWERSNIRHGLIWCLFCLPLNGLYNAQMLNCRNWYFFSEFQPMWQSEKPTNDRTPPPDRDVTTHLKKGRNSKKPYKRFKPKSFSQKPFWKRERRDVFYYFKKTSSKGTPAILIWCRPNSKIHQYQIFAIHDTTYGVRRRHCCCCRLSFQTVILFS